MKKLFKILGLLSIAFAFPSCGNVNNQSCQNGYSYSTYYGGCLAQSSCPSGQGLYNNQCVSLVSGAQTTGQVSCAAGSLYSAQYGCLPQANCPAGQGLYNNQCVAASGTVSTNGCPVAGQIYTIYGCLSQGPCPSGQVQYSGQCVNPSNLGSGFNNNCTYYYNGVCH
jgi:hypothetical protein